MSAPEDSGDAGLYVDDRVKDADAAEAAAAQLEESALDGKEARAVDEAAAEDAGVNCSPTDSSSPGGTRRMVRTSSSTASSLGSSRSSLSSTTRKKRYGSSTKRSPLSVPPPFDMPVVDQFGFPCAQKSVMLDEDLWDQRHHLNGNENELKPKLIRDYFGKYALPKELKRDLKYSRGLCDSSTSPSILRALSLPEVNDRKPSFICPDAGPPLVPTRHVFGGSMKDRDGKKRLWNDRWTKGIGLLNDNCHPDHRAYFTQKSLFEDAPSQDWRRYLQQEIKPGVWEDIKCNKPQKFPPLGGRLRGRSGTPIPGASP